MLGFHQIRSWLGNCFRFHRIICMALQWHWVEAPSPFFSKVGSVGFPVMNWKTRKIIIYTVSQMLCNSIRYWWVTFILILAFYVRGIAVTSHVSPTTISSKSRGNGSVSSFKVTGTKNRKKWGFRQCYVIKFVFNGLHCPNSIISFVWDYTGYIYKPMTNFFKNLGSVRFELNDTKNGKKRGFASAM